MSSEWWTDPALGLDEVNSFRDDDVDESQRKRQKRGKYVAKACNHCQRRKTKCEGGYPCNACIAKGFECVVRNAEGRRQPSFQAYSRPPRDKVLAALGKIRQQLVQIMGHDQGQAESQPEACENLHSSQESAQQKAPAYNPPQGQLTPKSDTEVFNGEPSLARVLHEMEGHLERLGMAYSLSPDSPASVPLTPMGYRTPERDPVNRIRAALDSHGITPHKDEWHGLLKTFCDEVHILYPFAHLPVLWRTYRDLCDRLLGPVSVEPIEISNRIKIAQVLFCLATGRCSESTRKGTEDGHHSAGWSLFQAGMDVLGDPLSLFDDFTISLEMLQAMILAVIYLFRIDATNKTEQFLALAISHSHLLGLHRRKVTDEMRIYDAEMFRRVWWCTYILDRRMAIDTGRPFLIQDVNTDVPLPLELDDSWLSQYMNTRCTSSQLHKEIELELQQRTITPLPHIAAMVDYSRVVSKMWEAHYGASDQNRGSSPLTDEYLEFLVSSTVEKAPSRVWSGSREPFHVQFAGMEWWQIKQKMLMRIRWLFLRLLIRRSSLRRSQLSLEEENANGMKCMQLCRSIILEFNHIPDMYPKHTFPFIHYVATATMIAVGLITKQPKFTTIDVTFVVQAAHMLRRFCTQTWVSGRIIRAVTKTNQAIEALALDRSRNSDSAVSETLGELDSVPHSVSLPNDPQLPAAHRPIVPNDHSTYLLGDSTLGQTSTAPTIPPDRGLEGSGQVHAANISLAMDTPVSSSSALGNLVMSDFDFEETLRRRNDFDSGWPCPLDFFDGAMSVQYEDVTNHLSHRRRLPSDMPGSSSDQGSRNEMAFSTSAPTVSEVARNNALTSDFVGRSQHDWVQTLLGDKF